MRSRDTMTPMERVMTTLGFTEPDRVPFFLMLTMHGAKELGLDIQEYFAEAKNVVEGQLRMQAKYRHDCLVPFFYAAVEVEAFGGEVIYRDDGPPNAGEPVISRPEAVKSVTAPQIAERPCLAKVLETIEGLKSAVGDRIPIIGVVMSPFSLPVMQMGFEPYLVLMHEQPGLFRHLMEVNKEFCIRWANAQLASGATAICYFDPVASPTITARETYLKTGFAVARDTIAAIEGPTATHLASGQSLPIVDDLCKTGTRMVGVSVTEDLAVARAACNGRLSVLGNLDGIAMRRWTPEEAQAQTRRTIAAGGAGGGFILADNHGEIPFQVPEDVLMSISQTVHEWGRYPLSDTVD